MAIIKCHECGNDVSIDAAACPECGAKPTPQAKIKTKQDRQNEAIAVIVMFSLLIWFFWPNSKQNSETAEVAQAAAACKQDIQCWGDKNIAAVSVYCKDSVERLAKFSVKWTDGTLETKFSRFQWLDKTNGTVKYFGDKAQFQNGFGAYQNVIYECDFDPATNKVLGVHAESGHL